VLITGRNRTQAARTPCAAIAGQTAPSSHRGAGALELPTEIGSILPIQYAKHILGVAKKKRSRASG